MATVYPSRRLATHPLFSWATSAIHCPVEGCGKKFQTDDLADDHLVSHDLTRWQAERWLSRRAYRKLAAERGWKGRFALADEIAMRLSAFRRGFACGSDPDRWGERADMSPGYAADWRLGYVEGQACHRRASSEFERRLREGQA